MNCTELRAKQWPYGPGRPESDTCTDEAGDPDDWRAATYERAATRPCRFEMSTSRMSRLFVQDRWALWTECLSPHPAKLLAFGARCQPRPDVPR